MGRAGWGMLFMTLISLAVAVNGLYMNNSVEDVMTENPTLDKLYITSSLNSVERSTAHEFAIYEYLTPNSTPISTTTEDYYMSSFSYTKTILYFLKDFFVPFSILGSVDGFPVFLIWLLTIIWNMIYGLLLIEVVWRFDLFS